MMRHMLLAVALGACRADEAEPERRPDWAVGTDWRSLVDCADWGEDCAASQCCKRPGAQCYAKNEWYGGCAKDCAPGKTPDGEEWTCEELGERTPKASRNKTSKTKASKKTEASKKTKASKKAKASKAKASKAKASKTTPEGSKASKTTAPPPPVSTTVEPPAATSTAADTAAPTPAPAGAAVGAGGVESLTGAEPSKGKVTSTSGDVKTTTTTAVSTDGGAPPSKGPPSATNRTAAAAVNGTAARAERCGACTPTERTAPDVVIPFWEHDLCKLGYTVESIARHDPNHVLGTVILMWVSQQPTANFQEAIDRLKDSLNGSHKVKLVDFSPQLNQGHVGGWLAQQVFKLKAAALVESDFYVVLDAKNTLIRDLEPDAFFTPCNQGKIYGEFEPGQIPQPHAEWYQASAAALGVQPPGSSGGGEQRWPTSITPMVIHRSTVFDLLDFIHEDRSTDNLCGGPLCEMLGARSEDGKGATEFTLFVLFARTRPKIGCHMAVEETTKEAPMAVSLWRGLEEAQMEVNLESCKSVASGDVKPWMFGAQTAALEALTAEQYKVAQGNIVDIYRAAGLHDGKKTSTDALMRCVAGDVEGVVGPIEDGGDEPADEEDHEEQPEGQGDTSESKGFCCSDARDSADTCGTCWPGATLYSDSYCGISEDHCSNCRGTWCGESEAEEEPPSGEKAWQVKVRASCEEFKCEGWDESSLCACTASCEQVCDDELLEIRMARKFSASGPVRASPGSPGWAGAALPLALLTALTAAILMQLGARRLRRWAPARWSLGGPPAVEREALVAPEDPACSA